jgi:hypothetical protein
MAPVQPRSDKELWNRPLKKGQDGPQLVRWRAAWCRVPARIGEASLPGCGLSDPYLRPYGRGRRGLLVRERIPSRRRGATVVSNEMWACR